MSKVSFHPRVLILLSCLPACLGLLSQLPYPATAFEDESYSRITEADRLISEAFLAVLEAEKVGVNVTNLIAELNSAGDLLAEAHTHYRCGDFEEAYYSANLSAQKVDGMVEKAEELKASANVEYREKAFRMTVASILAIFVVVAASIAVWLFLKRRYTEKVLEMTPEVQQNGP